MTILNCKTINGYIEGFYAKLFTWSERKRILEKLSQNKMYFYLYAPKGDPFHRNDWRKSYKKDWIKKFYQFCITAKSKEVQVFFGISPGLDFNFNDLINNNTNSDFLILFKKCLQILDLGADSIVLLLDDIPNDFANKYNTDLSEGKAHAYLANKLAKMLNTKIYVVPRVYSDELISSSEQYLYDFGMSLNSSLSLFYCGKNIIEKSINQNSTKIISKYLKNNIIFWDNYYANDYCPRRLFLGPWKNRSNKFDIMINPTGLIETDLLIIDIVGKTLNSPDTNNWETILRKHRVPSEFFKVKHYFYSPDFSADPIFKKINYNINDIQNLDKLLWNWHSNLSREWYPFFMGLKQDLQINLGIIGNDRIIKTQTHPFVNNILK